MGWTGTQELPDVIAKGVAEDARAVADELALTSDVPEALQIRIRGIQRELSHALVAALGGPVDMVRSVQALVAPELELDDLVRDHEVGRPMDRDRARLAMLGVAQAIEEQSEFPVEEPLSAVVDWLVENLGWTHRELAAAASVDERTLLRYRHDESPGSAGEARLRALVRVARPLRFAMTARGVGQWLHRPLGMLQQRAPVQVLDDETAVEQLEHVARQLRG